MRCREVLELLDCFVDAELDTARRVALRPHLDSCPECGGAYREVTQIKRLLQRRAFQPPIPGGLAARVLREIRRGAAKALPARFRTTLTCAAAALLALVVGWTSVSVFATKQHPLAHATVLEEIARRFECFSDFGNPVVDYRVALRQIGEQTGIVMERFPVIPRTRLVSWKEERIADRPCVCLCYHDLSTHTEGASHPPFRPTIMLFAIPSDGSRFPEKVHLCECMDVGGGTVFCFRYGDLPMSVVTTLDRSDMRVRLEQTIR